MDPFTLVLLGTLLVSAATAALMWPKILAWAENSLFPWVARNLPELEPVVRAAFSVLDKGVVALRNAARQAWHELRRTLLKQVAEFVRQFDGRWVVEVTSWIANRPDRQRSRVTKVVTQQEVSFEELPPAVRQEYLRNNQKNHAIDVTDLRDKEFALVEA
ncbi:hypothetical protein Ade02nite_47120 [Paractinoplanes deccanensis]|uniref:Uncharacterized protein n=1 Tax=Paractinoplanes deccanensis TaxID=113561 RepID=A0ABQ3Y7U8_9ACTN|nr:hypothetical protein [Actinoplanes deccanensis]GID76071.1 hypothetical protein Ade02nite_47120 [Actinoplanes deccanensis]